MPIPATRTRFAPSPTGYLHLGHAHSALFSAAQADSDGFLLRIEDIDPGRCRPEFEQAIFDDLAWLGLEWQTPVRRQSDHMDVYRRALAQLQDMNLLYPCFCTRKQIQDEIAHAGHAPHELPSGPDGTLYPGTCRHMDAGERAERLAIGEHHALRLKTDTAAAMTGALTWHDRTAGEQHAQPESFGDVVLARKDTPTSYHLAVTVDDAIQAITLVTRGEDLFAASHLHRLLQALLELPTPDYHHHGLITGPNGKRLAKRDSGATIRHLREDGKTPAEVRTLAGFGDQA
ncbi:MAG: tRNA glutamyl-Q(34) synthetase GluQRS [Rhodospirillaceae bacterium]|jgi:glutamyl-Q tRNA(Asp) synthetase|nr:tRNA glutamyl-Q(34) synthetase GluQRS [Rhodospirillaceae bacterium]